MDSDARWLRAVFIALPCVFMVAILVLPALEGLALSFEARGPSLEIGRAHV